MVASIRGYTPNYGFRLINFDTPRWHTLEYANWNMLDSLFLQTGTPQIRGPWTNNTLYIIGERVFDEDTSAVYRCLVEHTSAVSGSFADDRTANPTYWSLQLAGVPVYRDAWLTGANYVLGDIVNIDEYTFYLCTLAHIAGATFAADAAKWVMIFDAALVVADSEAARDAALGYASSAAVSAAAALVSENNSAASADESESWANDARATQGAFRWLFDPNTAMVDPTTGFVRFNNALPTAITQIAVSALSGELGNPDVSDWIVTWDDSTNPLSKGTVQLRKVGSPESFLIFSLTGSITDNSTWLLLDVTYVAHSGSLAASDPVALGFIRAGDTGPAGSGAGDMLGANNLSDVASVPTSRNNLGLGTAQIPTFSQVVVGNQPSDPMQVATKSYVDASPSLYISDTPPVGVQDGSMWWDSDRGTLYVYYNDGTSTQWVEAVALPALDPSQFVQKSGDTMSGHLVLPSDPTLALQAAPKQYVDASVRDVLAYSGMQVNGGFEVSQEFGFASTVVNGAYFSDNWISLRGGTSVVNAQIISSPTTIPGLPVAAILQATTAQAVLGANDYSVMMQRIEGYRISRLGWGTASAKPITIAFWSWHNPAGLYSVTVRNGANNRSYATTYTQVADSTPQYNVITIPGDTGGSWTTDNTAGLVLTFAQACGTTYTAPSANTWAAGNFLAAPGQINGVASVGHTLRFNGVTVLPGIYAPTATQSPLIQRPYDQELATCRRYWQSAYAVSNGYNVALGNVIFSHKLAPVMRASPTLSVPSVTYTNAAGLTGYGTSTTHIAYYIAISATGAGTALVTWVANARL